jgi:hypothetical protein
MSRLSFARTASGVPVRVRTPYYGVSSKPGTPASATVGSSGAMAERFEFAGDDARHDVGESAGRESDQKTNRPGGILRRALRMN